MTPKRVSIVGGAGYVAGELIRLLLAHPMVEIAQVASSSHMGQYLHSIHPNLRRLTKLRFCQPNDLEPCDAVFLCFPHGVSAGVIENYRKLAPHIIDLSADFRLRSAARYERWYGKPHPSPQFLETAIYGLPELHREELPEAALVSGVGCMATAAILGVAPLYRVDWVNYGIPLLIEAKIGSSAGGTTPSLASHHAERSHVVRTFEPTGHRHIGEVIQEIEGIIDGDLDQEITFTATAIELVRGVLVTAHVFLKEVVDERALWQLYREAYQHEPFIRLVKDRSGVYRYPEPKILAGSNYCDIGFELDANGRHVVVIAALDNLMKGAAGNAMQALNCLYGWDETMGLSFPGLHPI